MKKVLSVLLMLITVISIYSIVNAGNTSAAPNEMPNTDFISGYSPSEVYLTLTQSGPYIFLNAPIVWAKLSWSGGVSAGNYSVGIFDGCNYSYGPDYGPGQYDPVLNVSRDSLVCNGSSPNPYTANASQVEYWFCSARPDGTPFYDTISQMRADYLAGIYLGNPGLCWGTTSTGMSAGGWSNFSLPVTPSLNSFTGTRDIIMAAHYTYYAGTDPVYTGPRYQVGDNRVNAFKVRANDSNATVGYVAGRDAQQPTAVQNRTVLPIGANPGDYNNDYELPFGVPCNQGDFPIMRVRWKDADHASVPTSVPSDVGVRFGLLNVTTGATVPSETLASGVFTAHHDFIGGQEEVRDYYYGNNNFPMAITPGHLYKWRWESIQTNNGVQFWIPFDTREFYGPSGCFDRISCTVQILGSVYTGQSYTARYTVTNNSGVPISATDGWKIGANFATRDNAGTNNYLAATNDQWTRTTWPSTTINHGQTTTFDKVFQARNRFTNTGEFNPDSALYGGNMAGGSYDFDWRIVREGYAWFGNKCSTKVNVIGYNITCTVNIVTATVYSGDEFFVNFTVINNDPAPLLESEGWRLGANLATQDSSGAENFLAPDTSRWVRVRSGSGQFGASSTTYMNNVRFKANNRNSTAGSLDPSAVGADSLYGTGLPVTSPGPNHKFEFRMVREGVGWFGTKCTSTVTVALKPPGCPSPILSGVYLNGASTGYVYSGQPISVKVRLTMDPALYTGPIGGLISIPSSTPVITNSPLTFTQLVSNTSILEATLSTSVVFNTLGNQTITWVGNYGSPNPTCVATIAIANAPYFTVFGNDVSVGSTIASGNNCSAYTPPANATVKSFGVYNNSSDYRGTSAEFGIYSNGSMAVGSMFSSSLRFSQNSATRTTFSNTGVGYGQQYYGTSTRCIPDYYNNVIGSAASVIGGAGVTQIAIPDTSGIYRVSKYNATNNPEIFDTTDINGRVTVVVDGDIMISNNIIVNSAGGAINAKDAPFFTLIVRGDILIAPTVTRIDGFLIAVPEPSVNSNLTGRIVTCVNRTGPATYAFYNATNLYSNCGAKLTFNGAQIAKRAYLLRSSGSIYQSSTKESPSTTAAAEIFNFNSRYYSGVPNLPVLTQTSTGDQVINLAPIF